MAIKEGGKADELIRAAAMILVFFFAILSAAYDSALFFYLAIASGIVGLLHVALVSVSRW
jgi:hypothetical protein